MFYILPATKTDTQSWTTLDCHGTVVVVSKVLMPWNEIGGSRPGHRRLMFDVFLDVLLAGFSLVDVYFAH